MKRTVLFILIGCCLSVAVLQAETPKREFRGAWVTTAWAIDWPQESWGSAAKAEEQKQEMIQLLDSLQAANMNAVWFQVRSFCDAMYKSKYEPWSKYLTGTRGGTPSYDPLQLAIEEAHKRGIELHAWLNPYRYASSTETYGNLPDDYATVHPDWLMKHGDATILNPGLPEVRERIAAVVADIVEHYDVDGILFDDYFYLSGIDTLVDYALYKANNPEKLSQPEWRRENVNEMVRLVHDTIKATKPWVTFGIGPAPQVASSQEHADKYGVDRMTFNDWQYNGIYSDPLAWITRGTIDYVSPQIYWAVIGGNPSSFSTFSAWWAKVASRFGVHYYASHSVGEVGFSYGPEETERQIRSVRATDRNSAPGSVFYSIYNAVYKDGFIRHLRNTVYSTPALPPADMRYDTEEQLFVSDIRYSSYTLSWTAPADNLRFAVYCLPEDSVGQPGIFASADYLLGMTYDTHYKVPLKRGWTYAVSVLDRYGNEFPPMVRGAKMITMEAPELLCPVKGETVICPAWFRWKPVIGADSYFIQVAEDAEFAKVLALNEVADTVFDAGKWAFLEDGHTYFWRVRTHAANAKDVWSQAESFVCDIFSLISPANTESNVSLTPLLTSDLIPGENVTYTFEIATENTFMPQNILFMQQTDEPSCQVPESLLAQSTTYFARVTGICTDLFSAVEVTSEPVLFRTLALPVPQPIIELPEDNETIVGTEVQVAWLPQNAKQFRVELSTSQKFPPRNTMVLLADAYATSVTFTDVAEGNYWLRVRAAGADGLIDSPVQTLIVQAPTALEQVEEFGVKVVGNVVVADKVMPVQIYTADGRLFWKGQTVVGTTMLPVLPQGTYILQVEEYITKIIYK